MARLIVALPVRDENGFTVTLDIGTDVINIDGSSIHDKYAGDIISYWDLDARVDGEWESFTSAVEPECGE